MVRFFDIGCDNGERVFFAIGYRDREVAVCSAWASTITPPGGLIGPLSNMAIPLGLKIEWQNCDYGRRQSGKVYGLDN